MPKAAQSDLLEPLLAMITVAPDGLTFSELMARKAAPSARTLQRRLAALTAEGRVVQVRNWRLVKYRSGTITAQGNVTLGGLTQKASAELSVPVSAEGEEIKARVRQPLQRRKPVGYNIAFLEAYQPNHTWYLPEKLRKQLHSMGRSPAGNAPAGTFARDILSRLLIDLSWASSRLEGNTYNRLDTERLIQFGQAATGKDALETQMILNHKVAIEYLVHDQSRVAVNPPTMIALHALLSDSLLADPMNCGKLREHTVEISGSVYRPIALPQRIGELFTIMLDMAGEITDPFEQSFFLMVHLPYLQPFSDVNKRVSRLAANIPLIRHNLSPLSFIDVPERAYVDALLGIYEINRIELMRDVFVFSYERSCQQYVAVRSQMVPPDMFRLRYRIALAECVRAIVRGGLPLTKAALRQSMPALVGREDRTGFITLAENEFKTLHAGNAVRFGLRPLEFDEWAKCNKLSDTRPANPASPKGKKK